MQTLCAIRQDKFQLCALPAAVAHLNQIAARLEDEYAKLEPHTMRPTRQALAAAIACAACATAQIDLADSAPSLKIRGVNLGGWLVLEKWIKRVPEFLFWAPSTRDARAAAPRRRRGAALAEKSAEPASEARSDTRARIRRGAADAARTRRMRGTAVAPRRGWSTRVAATSRSDGPVAGTRIVRRGATWIVRRGESVGCHVDSPKGRRRGVPRG